MSYNLLTNFFYSVNIIFGKNDNGDMAMRKIIDGITYDTESATLDKKFTSGKPGDPAGYEESLYISGGRYFIYTNGGPSSRYPHEDITPIAREDVKNWILSHWLKNFRRCFSQRLF